MWMIVLLTICNVALSEPIIASVEQWMEDNGAPKIVVRDLKSAYFHDPSRGFWATEHNNKIYSFSLRKSPDHQRLKEASLGVTQALASKAVLLYIFMKQCVKCNFKNEQVLMQVLRNIQYSGEVGKGGKTVSWFVDGYTVSYMWKNINDVVINEVSSINYENIYSNYCIYGYKFAKKEYLSHKKENIKKHYDELLALKCNLPLSFYIELADISLEEKDTIKAQSLVNYILSNELQLLNISELETLGDVLFTLGDEEQAEKIYLRAINKI